MILPTEPMKGKCFLRLLILKVQVWLPSKEEKEKYICTHSPSQAEPNRYSNLSGRSGTQKKSGFRSRYWTETKIVVLVVHYSEYGCHFPRGFGESGIVIFSFLGDRGI